MNLTLGLIDFNQLVEAVETLGVGATLIMAVAALIIWSIYKGVPKLWEYVINKQDARDTKQEESLKILEQDLLELKTNLDALKIEVDTSRSISEEKHVALNSRISQLENSISKLTGYILNLSLKK